MKLINQSDWKPLKRSESDIFKKTEKEGIFTWVLRLDVRE